MVSKTLKTNSERIVVTAALPYANGDLHLGHLLEYIQADIFSRYLKLIGKNALYICASDMHGTPVEVNARKANISPEQFALNFWKEHQKDFAQFFIQFDNYYKTHSPENKELSEYFFNTLKSKNYIHLKKINVIYCNHCNRSLPDRYVKGICPYCSTADQYGDVCEHCGNALKGIDLINPKCSLCGRTPVQKESEHYFFKLGKFTKKLQSWLKKSSAWLQPEVKNWLDEWIEKGLDDWCISRDEPYFGFEIPDSVKETGAKKYFYVWLDAPIGYISSTKNYCDKVANRKCHWEDYWKTGQVYHIIGKDICYFHFLFWPAMLMAVGIPVPKLTIHGFITVDGQKMSKSRGTFITAKDFLKMYPVEALRYYYASHLDRKVVDIDVNFADFKAVNNNVLMGNLGNFCYRVLTFAERNYGRIETVANGKEEKKIIKEFNSLTKEINQNYYNQDFKSVVQSILKIADLGNAYFQKSEVWKNPNFTENKAKVGFCVNLVRNLAIIVQPILPQFSQKIFTALSENKLLWTDFSFSWTGKLKPVDLLVQKIDQLPAIEKFPLRLMIGEIKEVKAHPNADSLYLMKVDFGSDSGFNVKQVVAGLRKHLSAESLLHRKAVFCVNLKPAKLRGEMSEAMILAADDGQNVSLLNVTNTPIGEEVCFEGMENNKAEVTFDDFLKLRMEVQKGEVTYQGRKLSAKKEAVQVQGVKEKAVIK